RSDSQSEVVARVGRRTDARNGRGAARLVRFAAKVLGSAADYFLLREMWRDAEGFCRAAQCGEVVPKRRSGRVVYAFGCGIAAARYEVQVRFDAIQKGRRHSWCGSIRARRIWRCWKIQY